MLRDFSAAPGMTVELEISDVAFGGKGVARLGHKIVFVPQVIDGEKIAARVTREHKRFAEAELESVVITSPHRVTPPCPYFGRCGGCVYQHIAYEHQLALKWQQVGQTLQRIGGIAAAPLRPFVPSPVEYGYRNRITVHARDGVVGYFWRESNKLIDVEHCPIAAPEVNRELKALRAQRPRDGHYTLRAHEGPRVFQQANDHVAAALLETVERGLGFEVEAGLQNATPTTLIDAYCGAGFFSKHLRDRYQTVIGLDWDAHAIRAAQKDSLPHERYLAGNVDALLPPQLAKEKAASAVIVDPPATGLSETICRALLLSLPRRLIYVSCNPATLARDLKILRDEFTLTAITPLDMFPQTAEIEVVAVLVPASE